MNPKIFLTELKGRNVYRAAVAYGVVVAWFLTQLTTQVFPFFEIPNSAVRFVVMTLAIGFPIAMLLSWVCEFTPQGVVRTEDLDPVEARSVQRSPGTSFRRFRRTSLERRIFLPARRWCLELAAPEEARQGRIPPIAQSLRKTNQRSDAV